MIQPKRIANHMTDHRTIKAQLLPGPYCCTSKAVRKAIGLDERFDFAEFESEWGLITRQLHRVPKTLKKDMVTKEGGFRVFLNAESFRFLNVVPGTVVVVRRAQDPVECP